MISTGAKRVNTGVMLDCNEVNADEAAGWTLVSSGTAAGGPNSNSTNSPALLPRIEPRLHAGVYRAGGRFVAVNRPAAENEFQWITPDTARKLFANFPFRLQEERGRGNERLQGEIWRFFVTLMLLFLIAEGFLILPARAREESKPRVKVRRPAEVAA
jgi:hypothetical protein